MQNSMTLSVAAMALLAVCCGGLPADADETGSTPTELAAVPAQDLSAPDPIAWSLVDQDGRVVQDRDFHGRFRLMVFGYTSCPDICPTALADLAEAMEGLGDLGRFVIPVFVTIDPRRDTRAVLADYVAHFDPRIVALTGSEAHLGALRKAYHVVSVPGPVSTDGSYVIAHSALSYLVGPSGERIRAFAHDTEPGEVVLYLKHLFARIGA